MLGEASTPHLAEPGRANATAEERERARIACEIHDDTVQVLSALSVRLEMAEQAVGDAPTRAVLACAREELIAAAIRLRQVMYGLLPAQPACALRPALEAYCSLLFADSSVAFELEGDPGELPSPTVSLAYRLAQEALRNVRKHSGAQRVLIALHLADEHLLVRISDDGVGLDTPFSSPGSLHVGLRLLRQRVRESGGSATVGSGLDGRGTSVEIGLPIGRRAP